MFQPETKRGWGPVAKSGWKGSFNGFWMFIKSNSDKTMRFATGIAMPEKDSMREEKRQGDNITATANKDKREQNLINNAVNQVNKAFAESNEKSFGSRDTYKDSSIRFAKHTAAVWGIQNMKAASNKHIQSYVTEMMDNDLSPAYIKTELSGIRHLLKIMGGKNRIHTTNDKFGVPNRASEVKPGATREAYEKARELAEKKFGIAGRLTVDLQYCFGERINETQAMRARRIVDADKTGILYLNKSDGTKGGRPREIPVETPEQRQVINMALKYMQAKKKTLGDRLLTGREKGAVHRSKHAYQRMYADNAGILGNISSHDLRRAFAQNIYDRTTGDDKTRMRAVCRALGHGENRDDITARYVANRQK